MERERESERTRLGMMTGIRHNTGQGRSLCIGFFDGHEEMKHRQVASEAIIIDSPSRVLRVPIATPYRLYTKRHEQRDTHNEKGRGRRAKRAQVVSSGTPCIVAARRKVKPFFAVGATKARPRRAATAALWEPIAHDKPPTGAAFGDLGNGAKSVQNHHGCSRKQTLHTL